MKRHPAAIARDRWRRTVQYMRLVRGEASEEFLRNRIEEAFQQGWDEATRMLTQPVDDAKEAGGE